MPACGPTAVADEVRGLGVAPPPRYIIIRWEREIPGIRDGMRYIYICLCIVSFPCGERSRKDHKEDDTTLFVHVLHPIYLSLKEFQS